MASQTKHIYFNITMFSLMKSKEKSKIGGVSNFFVDDCTSGSRQIKSRTCI